MPTNLTESPTFSAVVTVPVPGDLRSSASVDTFAQQLADRTQYLRLRTRSGLFDITHPTFGADPTGAADSTAAIQAAIDAAAVIGGDVYWPGGIYKHSQILFPNGVSIIGEPGVTFSDFNHATVDAFLCTEANDGPPSLISDIRFIGHVAGTGTHIQNNSGARIAFYRCSWNGNNPGGTPTSNLQGTLARTSGATSELQFVDCEMNVKGTLKGVRVNGGKISLLGGSVSMPATYADGLIFADGTSEVNVSDVRLDLTVHASGTASAVDISSSNVKARVRGCTFDATGAPVAPFGVTWANNARLDVSDNRFLGAAIIAFGNGQASKGSRIELEENLALDVGTAATLDLTSFTRYKSITVKSSRTTATVVLLPPGAYPGHVMHYTYYNASATGVTPAFAATPISGPTIAPAGISAGSLFSGTMVWESLNADTTYRWVVKGAWVYGGVIV